MPVDVLVVSLGMTGGWRAAAQELAAGLERAGASVAVAEAARPRDVRTFALTDLVQARAARTAAARAIGEHSPRAVIYCSITAALLWPRSGAIYLDSVAAGNRPGRHGIWQRPVERRRLAAASLILPWSAGALQGLRAPPRTRVVVTPVPVEPSVPPRAGSSGDLTEGPLRDIAALTYAGDPVKRRLDLVLAAWAQARREGETLAVAGTATLPAPAPAGVWLAGALSRSEFRDLTRRARVLVAAPHRDEYGIAALEALADGCVLVSTRAAGAYPALELAERLDSRMVVEAGPAADETGALARAIRTALDTPAPGYAARAHELLAPYRRAAVDRILAGQVLPALLGRDWTATG